MVTMTSEMDKTQTSIVMTAKFAAENAARTTNPLQSEEMANHGRSVDVLADTGNANSGAGNTCDEAKSSDTTTATSVAAIKPLELSSVTISIEFASEDESSTVVTPADGVEAVASSTTTSTSTSQGATPKTPTTPIAVAKPATPTATPKISAAASATESAAITAAVIETSAASAAANNGDNATISESAITNDTTIATATKTSSPQASRAAPATGSAPTLATNAVRAPTNATTVVTTTAAASKSTSPVAAAAAAASTSTTKVNFSDNITSNSTCTSSTNSTSSVTSISAPAAAGGATGNGNGNGSQNHHNHQQSSQHEKSTAGTSSGSGSVGGADSSHNQLHGAKPSFPTAAITNLPLTRRNEDAPNILVYKKMEAIIDKMQAESTGVAVRTVKAFMSKVPSVFTGADLVAWILKNLGVEEVTEALHFAHLVASHGYIFPIDDHQLTVKNDGTFYRFQTPYFWPSNCWEPENTDYAVYLCKRTMQNKTRLELADYEAENLAKLQKMFSRKWEFIFMQAESQSKVAKKRDKLERKVLDSQERAFWDVHRPMPGCVNTTEIDIKKAYRRGGHGSGTSGGAVAKNPIEQLTRVIALRKQKLERRTIKVSKAAEALVAYYEQYNEFDYFITLPELPNPWQTDSTEMWDAERNSKDVPLRRVKRWGFSLRELLNDPVGREQFTKFLEKEYSGENLKFWESVQQMKTLPQSEIKEAIHKIWQEFLAPDAPCPVNVDSKSVELAREAVNAANGPNRWCFDVAAAHVYHLMKSDSYSRYLRSDMYKDYLNCSRKKIKSIPNLFGVKR
ncbi:regulator of G-protein signaling 7-like [Rhagoletis pomonella]|uniref:regulator of G-protein signaling 7-like n=1 Tax=Rhagoletis pomonella TaxID=28610 RepID=UPI00178245A0|nr:regulator of G-protein signaling 7-like [Rhagoletis pomonella]